MSRNLETVKQIYAAFGRGDIAAILDGGDQIAAEFEIACDVVSTGGHYRDEEMHLWTFDDGGKVIRLRHYTDTAKHMRAAGLG